MDQTQKYFEAIRLKNVLAAKILNNENIDGLFIFDPHEDLVLFQFNKRILGKEMIHFNDYIKSKEFLAEKPDKEWRELRHGGFRRVFSAS